MKKVYIESGCIGCGSCEAICPEVFEVDGISTIKKDCDIEKNASCIKEAAKICPVEVIKYQE
ncbi:MAG: hypothetical protein UR14_C0001G0033 [candidate division TM6 bacterium GW2011_GWE2_31_21]|nr:MAG: hypothetical protein UR14_C0001G0033 [candidate division TM6 bacterium GW2011_GWE2_31_21]KKP54087.1 MAG: hypothetical protein UR43_C0001G0105 [candidate division TM6 bacterium GW2011_GWF2_33_332]